MKFLISGNFQMRTLFYFIFLLFSINVAYSWNFDPGMWMCVCMCVGGGVYSVKCLKQISNLITSKTFIFHFLHFAVFITSFHIHDSSCLFIIELFYSFIICSFIYLFQHVEVKDLLSKYKKYQVSLQKNSLSLVLR